MRIGSGPAQVGFECFYCKANARRNSGLFLRAWKTTYMQPEYPAIMER